MIAGLSWGWVRADKAFAAFGNPNQWAIATSLDAVARETTQNSLDAIRATGGEQGDGALDFTLIRLAGHARQDFEDALGWAELRKHLDSMAGAAGKANAAGQLAGNLEAHDRSDDLLLLRIDDYGASGLGGPEYPDDETDASDYGNFIKLIRTDLFSDKAEASGGSYGLGKAVYWRYSRFQTAFFASRPAGDPQDELRFIGVCQGFSHQWQGHRYEGRGYLGTSDPDASTSSHRIPPDSLRALGISRRGGRPGTSALVVGFYDPEDPDHGMDDLVDDLRRGIESNFWPLLARDRLEIGLWKVDGGDPIPVPLEVDTSYRELVSALRSYDAGRSDDELRASGDVVVRPITIKVPARKSPPEHPPFEHEAHLVVTLSDTGDDERDDLENKICLFRGAEMVVETLDKEFPGQVYHAFLAAGVGRHISAADDDAKRADEFLRNAEPPSHDQWIPRSGTRGAPKVNLGNNYRQPYVSVLTKIRDDVFAELKKIFLAPPPPSPEGPPAVTQHLQFLARDPSPPPPSPRKPVLSLLQGHIEPTTQAWSVTVQADMANRTEGWSFQPSLLFVGDDALGARVAAALSAVDGCTVEGERVVVSPKSRGRRLTATFTMQSDPSSHPIPANQASVSVEVSGLAPAPAGDQK